MMIVALKLEYYTRREFSLFAFPADRSLPFVCLSRLDSPVVVQRRAKTVIAGPERHLQSGPA